ncbi:MAG: lipopolysaccharide transport periplasmic protein LptA, partial [Nitrospira sp.]|nr:lipopolysaccharide transport periplasmic protein LptA [Nitrospira sp.]
MAVLLLCLPCLVWAKSKSVTPGASASGSPPLDVTANRIDYRQDQDVYEADGSVVIQQGAMRLTA